MPVTWACTYMCALLMNVLTSNYCFCVNAPLKLGIEFTSTYILAVKRLVASFFNRFYFLCPLYVCGRFLYAEYKIMSSWAEFSIVGGFEQVACISSHNLFIPEVTNHSPLHPQHILEPTPLFDVVSQCPWGQRVFTAAVTFHWCCAPAYR